MCQLVKRTPKFAAELSDRFGGKKDLVVAAALLHDIADVWLERDDEKFDDTVTQTATKILGESGFSSAEIDFLLSEIIAYHSCYPGELPTTLEGKILATADALAHITTNFYVDVKRVFFAEKLSDAEYLVWMTKKLDRDYNQKLFFGEVKTEVSDRYEQLVAATGI